ncbi:MAG: spermidine/putrescine ABC transporter substrate-binding protein [Bacillota bacterium]|nr:spermidine/putrescine ABC transporter substrate-binding protein [Bacillota bacterium]
MKKLFALLLVAVLALSAFGGLAEGVVNVYNWEDYIDEEVIALFEKETGIKVNYMRFTLNEDMMVQVRTSPTAFDVVFPSDYAIERMIAEDLIQPIDYSKVPNAGNILEWLMSPDYDKEHKFSIPYMWGTVGILYDTTKVAEPVDSWGALFDEQYKGEVFMLDSPRDALGVALKYLGYSVNSKDPVELKAATDLLIDQKNKGIVKAYQVDETKDKMVKGEAALAVVWSGDAQYAINLNPNLAYVVPKEGSNVWVDGMVIPKQAPNYDNALQFIDFLCRPDIAAMNTQYIEYSSPNAKAIELIGEEYTSNTNLNPSQETIDNCEFFHDNYDVKQLYDTFWGMVKNAK